MQKFKVVREHIGDRHYVPGDEREAARVDVAHLVPEVLEPIEAEVAAAESDGGAKAAPRGKKAASE